MNDRGLPVITDSGQDSAPSTLDRIFREIKAETCAAAMERASSTYDRLAGNVRDSIVLFGAGPLGRLVLAGLRKVAIEPRAFSDNNPVLWGTQVEGLQVLSPRDAVRRYGQTACFVVTIYNGSKVRRQLTEMGSDHVMSYVPLMWKHADVLIPDHGIDLPVRIRDHEEEIRKCYSLLHDDVCRREFSGQLRWRYWGDFNALPAPQDPKETYFPEDLMIASDREVFVDCGAFDGDSIRSFIRRRSGFEHVLAFEPDPANRSALLKFVNALDGTMQTRFTVLPYAVGNRNGMVEFNATSSAGSRVAAAQTGYAVQCRKLDDLSWHVPPTYIKMDIEGAEPDALVGGSELLKRHLPVLAVCVYHRCQHLWQIPNLIRSISDEYAIFLRRYAEDCWEIVCYAVPLARLAKLA